MYVGFYRPYYLHDKIINENMYTILPEHEYHAYDRHIQSTCISLHGTDLPLVKKPFLEYEVTLDKLVPLVLFFLYVESLVVLVLAYVSQVTSSCAIYIYLLLV